MQDRCRDSGNCKRGSGRDESCAGEREKADCCKRVGWSDGRIEAPSNYVHQHRDYHKRHASGKFALARLQSIPCIFIFNLMIEGFQRRRTEFLQRAFQDDGHQDLRDCLQLFQHE